MIKKCRAAHLLETIAVFCLIVHTRNARFLLAKDVRVRDHIQHDTTIDHLLAKQLEVPRFLEGAITSLADALMTEVASQTNVTQVLLEKFSHLFIRNDSSGASSPHEAHEQHQANKQHLNKASESQLLAGPDHQNGSQPMNEKQQQQQQQQQSNLETRTNLDSHHGPAQALNQMYEPNKRNFVRILNRVFSRVELPDSFRRSPSSSPRAAGGSQSSSSSSANLSSSSVATGAGPSSTGDGAANGLASGSCSQHVGCIPELPNFPVILKLKPNVSASFTIYTRERGHKNGQRILFEPLMHYQLQDGSKMSDHELKEELVNITRQLKLENLLPMMPHYKHNPRRHHHHHHVHSNHLNRQELRQRLKTTSASWLAGGNRIVSSKEIPFDLAALEQSGFNASLTTRVIIGGYFAKEEEEWIEELVRQWLLLEPANVIKVSWQDSNRGLYHSAAFNSRIVGRQLSLFLHYLNELFHIDLNRFHLVGHSLGAHIAGFVGADNEGQIARITGLDPAGPIFVELGQAHRLDPSDAKFVDVVHTNGGTITKGALGLSTPSGHVDYYSNGGSLQPGCFLSSVTMSIMDPVERIACNHRRSYRYFTEIIKLAIKQRVAELNGGADRNQLEVDTTKFPHAFLFEAKNEDLVKLVQPDVKLIGGRRLAQDSHLAPARKLIEFHSLNADFPRDKRGIYYFRTRNESPFFGSKQFALRFGLEQAIKRKITLSIKINTTLVSELELDELDESRSLVFVLQNPSLIDHANLFAGKSSRAPDLWLMWRQRSFNLLLGQSNELHLNSIELELLDDNELVNADSFEFERELGLVRTSEANSTAPADQTNSSMTLDYDAPDVRLLMRQRQQFASPKSFIIRYEPNVVNSKQNNENFLSRIQHNGNGNKSGPGFLVSRNQWHKFDGRPVAV